MSKRAFIMGVMNISVGIFITGMALDEAGRGTFGKLPSVLAKKVTRGFGV